MSVVKPSLRKAINKMCSDCVYDSQSPGSRAVQIAICTATDCALYPVRPMTATVIPIRVLEDYGLTVEQLDPRARPFVSPEARDGHLVNVEAA